MYSFFLPFLFLHLPALVICSFFYLAGVNVLNPRVGRWLRVSAVVWLAILWTWFTFVLIVLQACHGNMVEGFQNCIAVPVALANFSLPIFVLLVALAIIYGFVLAIVSSWLEWRYNHKLP
jgi:hypothetical protein